MGNWQTKKITSYFNVRLTRDAKHFPESGTRGTDGYKPAATYLGFVDGTKGGEDIFVDARIIRGAHLFSGLRKGDIVSLVGPVSWKNDKNGVLRGTIWDVAEIVTAVNLKERAEGVEKSPSDPTPEMPLPDDTGAPSFD